MTAPLHTALQTALGHHQAGRLAEAEMLYRRILAVDPDHVDSLHLLGVIAHHTGHSDAALALIGRALAVDERRPELHNNLGEILRLLKRPENAIQHYRRALSLQPGFAAALNNLGLALHETGRLAKAVGYFRRALALSSESAGTHNNLANSLLGLGDIEQAETHYRVALELCPTYAEAHMNFGNAQKARGQLQDALVQYRLALALKPTLAEAHWNEALVLLALGQFREGWQKFEARWAAGIAPQRHPMLPDWTGAPLAGRTILLYAEQGFGDTLQFIRFAPLVHARGGRVIAEVPPDLVRLLAGCAGIEAVVAMGTAVPPAHCRAALMSLPHLLGTTVEAIPAAVPYLAPPPAVRAAWAARIAPGSGLRVGLVWAGDARRHQPAAHLIDRCRSLALERFAPLMDIPGIQVFSLQKGEAAEDRARLSWGARMTDLMELVVDFADTAALIETLDLVIGVDTAVVHLAGALGKPVWVLSRFDGCWRWLVDRTDSPWYPTLRLFHQRKQGDWEPVIAEVAESLRSLVGAHSR